MKWLEREIMLRSIKERLIFTILIYSTTIFPSLILKLDVQKVHTLGH